jgi:hypothetical protein
VQKNPVEAPVPPELLEEGEAAAGAHDEAAA